MNDGVLWGAIFMAWLVPFLIFEVSRQWRRGDGYSPDRWTAVGTGGAAVIWLLQAIKVPPGPVLVVALVAAVAGGIWYAARLLKRLRSRSQPD